MTLVILLTVSILTVWLINKFQSTRKLLKEACRINRHPSFILDLTLLLPLVGILVEVVARRIKNFGNIRQSLYATAIGLFLVISGSLYLDYLNFSILTPLVGHPEAWGGNHFMWNSGIEVLGLKPFVNTTVPTYHKFFGFWNVFALILFALYPVIMIKAGTRLHGLIFGYTKKQTGISALFFERKAR